MSDRDSGHEPAGPANPGAGAAADLVGTVLAGRYRILSKVGEGAMGAVYVGEHVKIGRRDAIKVLRDEMARDPEASARFLRGARNVSTIRHPNVCTIYDFSDTADGLQFLAMELVGGDTLSELLSREGALPVERAVGIAVQVAEALQAAHDAGIVHRDLKPGNIMIAEAPGGGDLVKVVDFDIAKGPADAEGAEVTQFGFVVGTPVYMSPEQLTGEPLDGRSDIYSLGIVLFRMLTGELPFRAGSTEGMMLLRLSEPPLRLEDVAPGRAFPPAVQSTLDRALARSRDERHPTAAEFARDLAAALTTAPPPLATPAPAPPANDLVPPTRATSAVGGWPGNRGVVAVAAGVAALVVLAIAGWALAGLLADSPQPDGVAAGVVEDGTDPAPPPMPPRTPSLAVAAASPTRVSVSWTADASEDAEVHIERAAGSGAFSILATVGEDSGSYDDDAARPATEYRYRVRSCIDARCSEFSAPVAVTTPPADAPAPGPAPEPARRTELPAAAFPVATVEEVLFRQMDALDEPTNRARIRAVRDTAVAVWDRTDIDAENRAWAAYVAASAQLALGDAAECVRWLERALRLRPDGPGFDSLLEACRGRVR